MKKAKSIKPKKTPRSRKPESPQDAYRRRLVQNNRVFPSQEIATRGVVTELSESPIAEHRIDKAIVRSSWWRRIVEWARAL